ncbi:aspartate aminotransferase-like enzyme [Thermosporothrix hazakensis]|jgi:aspartate aminotransferase-like enzyme|uniref:Aspartate aminotransferase-like enzyme n=1 Tax=Thermosporothrix hazakensis TaxID=644383 RepID=A0A326UBD6_THEHA|nr:alanine--glyoxylate aminotransferase family protein [Thermosporothrix hazakensis]PZW30611.1 aspartate aminotransferase-like enzyme [Thermosporothrix hazakensis]GCE49473.1 class V aminotransferase [Thermosporothrix hazakensis]
MTTQQKKEIPVPQVEKRQPIPKQNLRVPGPTPIPPEASEAQTAPMINHRGPEFSAMMKRITLRLQYFFQTEALVMTYPASGTGGQECAIVNVFSPGDHVVSITIGNFGNRMAKIAEAYGLQVTRLEYPWGEAAEPASVEKRLQEVAPYKGVLLTHNETSTGVTNDIETLARIIRKHNPDALIIVDAVSSLACVPLEMDAWDLDVVFTGSQKGWMVPPGLMMIAASPRAWEAYKTAKLPRFYFDWEMTRKSLQSKWQHPTTPPLSVLYALDVTLEMMLEEGRQAIFDRHQRAGEYVRNRAKALGLDLLADHQYASNTVTAIKVPEGIDLKVMLKKLREEEKTVFAGGQGQLDGKIFRIGHLGYFTEADLQSAVDNLEHVLHDLGYKG